MEPRNSAYFSGFCNATLICTSHDKGKETVANKWSTFIFYIPLFRRKLLKVSLPSKCYLPNVYNDTVSQSCLSFMWFINKCMQTTYENRKATFVPLCMQKHMIECVFFSEFSLQLVWMYSFNTLVMDFFLPHQIPVVVSFISLVFPKLQ